MIMLIMLASIMLSFLLIICIIWSIEYRHTLYYLKHFKKENISNILWANIEDDGDRYRYPKRVRIKTPKGEVDVGTIALKTHDTIYFMPISREILIDGRLDHIPATIRADSSSPETNKIKFKIIRKKISKELEEIIAMENL